MPSPAVRGGPEPSPGGAGAPGTWLPGREGRRGGRTHFSSAAWRAEAESAARGEAASVGSARACGAGGPADGPARPGPPGPPGRGSSALAVVASPPLSAARCEAAAAPLWLSARLSSARPLGAGAAAAARSAAAGGGGGVGGGGLAGWGRRPGRGHREEVSVSGRLLLSPLFAPASLWR